MLSGISYQILGGQDIYQNTEKRRGRKNLDSTEHFVDQEDDNLIREKSIDFGTNYQESIHEDNYSSHSWDHDFD